MRCARSIVCRLTLRSVNEFEFTQRGDRCRLSVRRGDPNALVSEVESDTLKAKIGREGWMAIEMINFRY